MYKAILKSLDRSQNDENIDGDLYIGDDIFVNDDLTVNDEINCRKITVDENINGNTCNITGNVNCNKLIATTDINTPFTLTNNLRTTSIQPISTISGNNYIITSIFNTAHAIFNRYRSGGTSYTPCGLIFSSYDSRHTRIFQNGDNLIFSISTDNSSNPTTFVDRLLLNSSGELTMIGDIISTNGVNTSRLSHDRLILNPSNIWTNSILSASNIQTPLLSSLNANIGNLTIINGGNSTVIQPELISGFVANLTQIGINGYLGGENNIRINALPINTGARQLNMKFTGTQLTGTNPSFAGCIYSYNSNRHAKIYVNNNDEFVIASSTSNSDDPLHSTFVNRAVFNMSNNWWTINGIRSNAIQVNQFNFLNPISPDNYIITNPSVGNTYQRFRSGSAPFLQAGTVYSNFDNLHVALFSSSAGLNFATSTEGSTTPSSSLFTTRMVINTNGDIGIGTTLPSRRLHVVGDILCTSAFIGGNGVNTYSLTTNGGTIGDLFINSGGGSSKIIHIRPHGAGTNQNAVEFDSTNNRVLFRNSTGNNYAAFNGSNNNLNISDEPDTPRAERLYISQNNFSVARFRRSGLANLSSTIAFQNSNGTENYIGIASTNGDIIFGPNYVARWNMAINLTPFNTNTNDIGSSALRIKDIYTQNSINVLSDLNHKTDVTTLDKVETMNFIKKLRPVNFKYTNNTSGRVHTGLIAQEYKQAILDSNLTTLDDATYIEEEVKIQEEIINSDGQKEKVSTGNFETIRSLRYEEIIGKLISCIQHLEERITVLENMT